MHFLQSEDFTRIRIGIGQPRHNDLVNYVIGAINEKEQKIYDDQVEGRNSVLELIESGKDVNKIFVAKGEKHRFYK